MNKKIIFYFVREWRVEEGLPQLAHLFQFSAKVEKWPRLAGEDWSTDNERTGQIGQI